MSQNRLREGTPIDHLHTPPPAPDHWFAGDARLYSIDGPLDGVQEDNPERLCIGCAVMLPRTIRDTFGFRADTRFTLVSMRRLARGSMGFCEIAGQPGRGLWVLLRHLSRPEWHTSAAFSRHRRKHRP